MLDLSSTEEQHYAISRQESMIAIDDAVSNEATAKAYQSILQAILKLRLICNHGTFEQASDRRSENSIPSDPDEALALLQQGGEATCAYCSCEIVSLRTENLASGFLTVCSHLLCPECLPRYEGGLTKPDGNGFHCPLCQQLIGLNYLATTDHRDALAPPNPPFLHQEGYSTKIFSLVKDLEANMDRSKGCVSNV
jgi:hypothetical protein